MPKDGFFIIIILNFYMNASGGFVLKFVEEFVQRSNERADKKKYPRQQN